MEDEGFEVGEVSAGAFGGIEQDEGFGTERIAQNADPGPVHDGVSLADIAEGDGQGIRRDRGHVFHPFDGMPQKVLRFAFLEPDDLACVFIKEKWARTVGKKDFGSAPENKSAVNKVKRIFRKKIEKKN